MADEKPKPPSGTNKRRRRRSSRNRKQGGPPKTDAVSTPSSQPSGGGNSSGSNRRRRRRRSRSKDSQNQPPQQAPVRDMLEATLPESIFVYTHVLRSSELDTYGFRSDPFLNHSRGLEDFRIDLTPLFPADAEGAGTADERIFDAALHGPVVATLADSADDEDEDEAETGEEGPRNHRDDASAESDEDAFEDE